MPQGAVSPRLLPGDSRRQQQQQPQQPAAAKAEDSSEQQLIRACELMLLQRHFRELLLEEFVTTLHLVSQPMATLLKYIASDGC